MVRKAKQGKEGAGRRDRKGLASGETFQKFPDVETAKEGKANGSDTRAYTIDNAGIRIRQLVTMGW